jgi:hypothetical protein
MLNIFGQAARRFPVPGMFAQPDYGRLRQLLQLDVFRYRPRACVVL